ERHALNARVQIHAALAALVEHAHRHRQQIAAARAAEDLVRRHQVRRLRSALVLQHAAGRPFAWRRRPGRRSLRALAALIVLITALSILAIVAHVQGFVPGAGGGSAFRNSARSLPHTVGSECVPWPRVLSLVGMSTYFPRFTRGMSCSINPSSGGFTTSSAELMAKTAAVIVSSFADG